MAGTVKHPPSPGKLRRLYDYCMRWISGKHGEWALFVIAFVESSFFLCLPMFF